MHRLHTTIKDIPIQILQKPFGVSSCLITSQNHLDIPLDWGAQITQSAIQSHRAPVLRETHLRKQRVDSRNLAYQLQ